MKDQCPHCGITNWAGAEVCVRCKKSPDEPVEFQPVEEKFGVERLRDSMGPVKMPAASKALVGVMAVIAIFCVVSYLRSDASAANQQAGAAAPRGVNANPPISAAANANAAPIALNPDAIANMMKMATPVPMTTVPNLSDADMKRLYDKAIEESRKNPCDAHHFGPGRKPGC